MSGFICKATLPYDIDKKLKALDAITYDNFRRRVISCRDKLPATHAELSTAKLDAWSLGHDLLIDGDELEAWSDVGIDLTVGRVKGLASNARDVSNTIFQVSVANVGLMQVTAVEVLEDTCTDELQRWLDKGWRIIAVCPPNDARRPTYIMGHTDRHVADAR